MKCFACLKVVAKEDLSKADERQPPNINEGSEENKDVSTNDAKLDSRFMLRKFLRVPEGIFKQLRDSQKQSENPDQDYGIHCCASCSSEVMKAKGVLNDFFTLQKQYIKMKQEVKGTIVKSVKSQENLTSKNSKENETDIVRRYVTQEHDKYSPKATTAEQDLAAENPVEVNKDHIRTLATDPPSYFCQGCLTPFTPERLIKVHQYCLGAEKPYKCEECGSGYIKRSYLNQHMKVHAEELPYGCSICKRRFNEEAKLTLHMNVHSFDNKRKCVHCEEEFGNMSALKTHLVLCSKKPAFECPVCKKTFSVNASLNEHLKSHGESFECKQCQKIFKLKISLDDHMRSHSKEQEKPEHKCDQCGKVFLKMSNFRRHMLNHSEDTPFKCSMCESAFKRKDLLRRHMKGTHSIGTPMEVDLK